jgi:hypothetical protein
MSNVISLFKTAPAAAAVSSSNAIWVTGHAARYVRYQPCVREIDPVSFFADSAWQEMEDAYGAALRFLDNLMEDLTFWESL